VPVQKQFVLGAGSQTSLPPLVPASAAQSVSIEQLLLPCWQFPQPRNSPGARHMSKKALPQS
jgi:hypothetical protein